MNKKDKQKEAILNHGFKLQRIYPDTGLGPVALYKKMRFYEGKASRLTELMCSYPIDMEKADKELDRIESRVNEILNDNPKVFINRDPRGYALKIETEDAKELDIHKDWGGYGIICPEF